MTKIENKAQYDWAVNRVEELLSLVDDNTPKDDASLIELELLSNLVADCFRGTFCYWYSIARRCDEIVNV